MLKRKSMESFLREATVLKSVNYVKASGKLIHLFYNILSKIPILSI